MLRQIFLLILFSTVAGYLKANPIDTILNRAERYLRDITPLMDVRDVVANLTPGGQWPDIDYSDNNPSGWALSAHLQRVRNMALAYTDAASPLYRSQVLREAIDRSLDHWLEKRYKNSNWWHNQIGVPKLMQDIIVLLRHDLTPLRFKGALEVMAQLKVWGIGANLVWTADLGLHYGVLSGDEAMIEKYSGLISNEIAITTGEGIQPDYSYHQHDKRLQTYHYGAAYLRENIKLAWELKGTPWEFPADKTDILLNFILEGWQWMARGVHTVPGTLDRSVSRVGTLRAADLRDLIPYIVQLKPERKDAITAIAKRQDGNGEQLRGFRHYPYSDFSAYHRPEFSFFVKTISDRTRFSESINNENLKGRLLNSGDAYFIRDGNEYFDLMPAWNWEYLPGITSFPGADTKPQPFTGGVSCGESGFTVMHHTAQRGDTTLSVRKAWAAHGDVVICLMADLRTNSDSVFTVLDQCRWRGDVLLNGSTGIQPEGIHKLGEGQWLLHAGLAYIPLSPTSIELHLTTNQGSWSDITLSGSKQLVSEQIFMPLLRHGSSKSAAYAVASVNSAAAGKKIVRKKTWTILRNDGQCQSVVFDDGTVMAAFLEPTNLLTKRKAELSVDRPCLIIISDGKLYVSDPAHKGGVINITVGKRAFAVNLPADGTTTVVEIPQR